MQGTVALHCVPAAVQAPDPRQVQHTIVEQRRRAVQHKIVARAGRNAQKSGNKRERQQMKASLQLGVAVTVAVVAGAAVVVGLLAVVSVGTAVLV